MLGKKDNNDYFLEFLDGVTPIKKSDKNFKKIKITNITKTKKIVQKSKEKVVSKEKKDLDLYDFEISKTRINKKLKKGKIQIDKKIDFHGFYFR